jgi:hypothetical protein
MKERAITLAPLKFQEALSDSLKVKPPQRKSAKRSRKAKARKTAGKKKAAKK